MFSKNKNNLSLLFCLVLFVPSFVYGQTRDNKDAEVLINSVTEKAGANFKEGLIALKDNLRPFAREKFDKAIEVFLMSTLNVQRNPKLQDCYNQLVDTVYLIEFPSNQKPPQIKILSATCGWNISDQLADDIAKLVSTFPPNNKPSDDKDIGFTEQKYKPTPIDELTILEPTEEEPTINTSVYTRPPVKTNPVRVVKAQKDDTITTIAAREKVSPVEVAKLNGLLTTTKLPVGREIKIPNKIAVNIQTTSVDTPCYLTLKNAPVLRGLRLGMTSVEASKALGIAVIPKSKKTEVSFKKNGNDYIRIPSFGDKLEYEKNKRELDLGEETFYYMTSGKEVSAQLDGIGDVYLVFHNKLLYYISISYNSKDIRWANHKEFILNISGKLSLPENSWRIMDNIARLSCVDFSITSLFRDTEITLLLSNSRTLNEISSAARLRFIELDKKENTVDYEKKKVFKP